MDAILIDIEETEHGVEIFDQIQRTRFELHFDGAVGPAETDVFEFPAKEAVRLETGRVTVPTSATVWARSDGEHCATTTVDDPEVEIPLESGLLQLNVISAPMKVYLVATGPVSVQTGSSKTVIATEGDGFTLGVRSPHDLPAATVTTTDDPVDFMRAVSTFGSGLQTTSPERSWQTLRGHPPELQLGDELDIPTHLDRPQTDIQIEVPPALESVFAVSTLAYYLGAEVVPASEESTLIVGDSRYRLGAEVPLHREASELLRHLFLMDTIVRTEGIYRIDLHERSELTKEVELDVPELYSLPIAARTNEYLDVDRRVSANCLSGWPVTTTVTPTAENGTLLPYLVDELSLVHPPETKEVVEATPTLEGFLRSDNDAPARQLLSASDVETPRHQWVGRDLPLHASRPTKESFRRRLQRTPKEEAEISITVVCNDDQMLDELSADLYPDPELISFDLSTRTQLTRDELTQVFRGTDDFVHYIGHGREDGVQCSDGWLDLREIAETGVEAFLLNGCQSLRQGEALVEAGAIGGVVSLSDVGNTRASRLGRELSKLLAYGHSLGISLHVLRQVDLAQQFAVVGLDGFSLCQCPDGAPKLLHVRDLSAPVVASMYAYQTELFKLGSVTRPHLDGTDWYLNTGYIDEYEISSEESHDFFTASNFPVIVDGTLRWSQQLFTD
ncbi:CHAT domain-containing protein [Salinirubrum litoreum]|uniref:CHAT domain-containing protein n=1 Tax=Salinirubrum litoreum TaxID=1126234 RepID=A0ABD5RAQ8_9EURY|nr:CHAT domain-containing protein [Salinirubrum litoreum]